MNKAANLLNFNFDKIPFGRTASSIISRDTEKSLETVRKKLSKISTPADTSSRIKPSNLSITYRRFMQLAPQGQQALEGEFKKISDVRKLAYSLTYYEGNNPPIILSEYLKSAIEIIINKWRFSMLLAIFNALLKNWSKLNTPNGEMVRRLIFDRISNYSGKNKLFFLIQDNIEFFTKHNGAAILGGKTAESAKRLTELRESLGLPDYMDNFEYFGEVALAFTHTIIRRHDFYNFIYEITNFLRRHNHEAINKQCISKLILKLDSASTYDYQDTIQETAFELLGDPAIDAYWSPWEGASQNDKQDLKRAQNVLNEWITRKCIGLFFEKFTSMDFDRKEFWLRYVKKINKFKIYASWIILEDLRNDERIASLLENRFGFLDYGSALVMVFGNYTLIEFGTEGNAFYAYKCENPLCPNIQKKSVSLQELKHPHSMGLLMNYKGDYLYNLKPEGRFIHKGHWQGRLGNWLSRYLGI